MSNGVDTSRRRFLTASTSVVGGVGMAAAAVPFVSSWLPSARAKAIGAPIEVDIAKMEPGQRIVAQWRGQPVWVLRRSQQSLQELGGLTAELRDPDSAEAQQPGYARNEYRSIKPEVVVLVGLCTHLGCSPTFIPEDAPSSFGETWKGGFFCPCHGSKFDLAGRVYKGVPAPLNLLVPPYRYVNDTTIIVGEDQGAA